MILLDPLDKVKKKKNLSILKVLEYIILALKDQHLSALGKNNKDQCVFLLVTLC